MRKTSMILIFLFLSYSLAFARLSVSVVERPMGVKIGYPVAGSASFNRIFSDKPTTYTQIFEPTRGLHTLPMIKIVVLDDGDNRIILGRTDAIGMSELLTLRVSQYVKEKTGEDIYPYLFISGNHTHSGPGRMSELILFSIATDTFLQEIFDELKRHVGDAIIEALNGDFRPAKLGYSYKKLGEEDNVNMIHYDRRDVNDDLYGAGNIEHTLAVIRIDDAETDEPICAFINFPIHGTIIQLSKFRDKILVMSGDAPIGIEQGFEEAFYRKYGKKIIGIFIQSSTGDVGPGGTSNGHELLQAIDAVGKIAAPTVLKVWEEAGKNMKADVKLTYSWRVVPLSVDAIYRDPNINPEGDRFDYPYGAYGCHDDSVPDSAKDENGCVPLPNPELIKYERYSPNPIVNIMLQLLVDECSRIVHFVPTTAHLAAIKVGDFLIVTAPGEATSPWWFALRDEVKQKTGISDVFLWGYTLDHNGYILTPEDFDRGDYESSMSFWGRRFSDYIKYHLVQLAEQVKDGKVDKDEQEINDGFNPHYDVEDYTYTPVASTKSNRAGDIEENVRKEIERFEPMRFRWIGGDTICGVPEIKVERREGNRWVEALDARGRTLDEKGLSTYLEYGRSAPDCEHYWYFEWELQEYEPEGKYRVRAKGKYSDDGKSCNKSYDIISDEFTVKPNQALLVGNFDIVSQGHGNYLIKAKLYYPPNRKIGLRARDPFVNVNAEVPLSGERASAGEVKFTIVPEGETQTSAVGTFNPETGFFEASFSFDLSKNYEVFIESGNGKDSYGNTNCPATLPILVQSGNVVHQAPVSISAVLKRPAPGKEFEVEEVITFEAGEQEGIYGYLWHFGNGDFACGRVVRYAYGIHGEYNASLIVYNGAGETMTKNFVVKIKPRSGVNIPPDFDEESCPMNIAVNDCFGTRLGKAEVLCGHCGFTSTVEGGLASIAVLGLILCTIAIWRKLLNK